MKKLFLSILVLGLLGSNVGSAATITIKDYKRLKNTDPKDTIIDIYIEGALQGSMWTNALSDVVNEDTKNYKKIFCLPNKMVIELANAKTIIRQEIPKIAEDLSLDMTESDFGNVKISEVLVFGLKRTFPCK